MLLRDKVAIITGAASGIGKAIAIAFAREGAAVVVDHLHDPGDAARLVRSITDQGGRACAVPADVSDTEGIERLFGRCASAFGPVDILVNNAGIETRSALLETSEAEYDRVLAVDLKAAFFCLQRAAHQMIAAGKGGRILNISSVHEDQPMPGNTAYCCAKGGLRMLTRTAGVELAPHGITVVAIAPGAVDTPINTRTLLDPAARSRLQQAIPLGRVARPEEVAELAVWLASENADYLTATTVFIDGGMMRASTGL